MIRGAVHWGWPTALPVTLHSYRSVRTCLLWPTASCVTNYTLTGEQLNQINTGGFFGGRRACFLLLLISAADFLLVDTPLSIFALSRSGVYIYRSASGAVSTEKAGRLVICIQHGWFDGIILTSSCPLLHTNMIDPRSSATIPRQTPQDSPHH